ncbi:MAG: hypothetical protein ABEK36_06240 [Candidatus Aenigmatarchaeota archaeon]
MGLLQLTDIGRTFTGRCTSTVSGGMLLKWNGSKDAVTSSGGYDDSDIKVEQTDSETNCVGIALFDAGSNENVSFSMQGLYILQAGSGAVSGGMPVYPVGYSDMVSAVPLLHAGSYFPIGRALTDATPLTGYAIVRINI